MREQVRLTEINDWVREEFARVLSIPTNEIPDDAQFYVDLSGDSLQWLELVARVEERFGIRLADADLADADNVRDVAALVADKLPH